MDEEQSDPSGVNRPPPSKSTGRTLDYLYKAENDYDDADIENSCIYEVDEGGKVYSLLIIQTPMMNRAVSIGLKKELYS